MRRLLAAYLLGVATAIWLMPAVIGPGVQRLRLGRDQSEAEAERLRFEVQKLKDSMRTGSAGPVIKRVSLEIEGPDDRVVQAAKRRLQQTILAEQVGRSVDQVSPVLLQSRLQGTLMEIDGVRYQLAIRLLAIGTELAVYGELAKLK